MTPAEYIKNVLITEARDFAPLQERFSTVRNIRLLHGAIGLASELAEIRQMARQSLLDTVNLKEEIGDIYWYMGIMIDELKVDPNTVLSTDKLQFVEVEGIEEKKDRLNLAIDDMTITIGETIDLLKKSLMYGKLLNDIEILNKLRNITLDTDRILSMYGLTAAESRSRNIEKLRARYGEKFTEAAALERNLTVEREILEKK